MNRRVKLNSLGSKAFKEFVKAVLKAFFAGLAVAFVVWEILVVILLNR